MKMYKHKKGQAQMQAIGMIAVGVAALAITLTIAFLVLGQGKVQAYGLITATDFTNVTKVLPNGTATTFSECIDDVDLTISEMYNSSGADQALLDSNNYTISGNAVTIAANTGITSSDSKNLTYSCKTPSYAYNSTETMQNSTDSVPGWVPVIIIVFVGSILLTIVRQFRK